MSEETTNMWGDLSELEPIRMPETFVKEQAAVLSQLTQGVLQGKVETGTSGGGFVIDLVIVAPRLNNYRYEIVRVSQPFEIYPLDLYDLVNDKSWNCGNESDFLARLEGILKSPGVRRVITVLVSHSRA